MDEQQDCDGPWSWAHEPLSSSAPPPRQTPQDFVLTPVPEGINDVQVLICPCDPPCPTNCCRGNLQEDRPSNSDSEMSDEYTPLLSSPEARVQVHVSATRCACHEKQPNRTTTKARNKLIIACILALFFMIGEIIGGYFSNSLAILTDAAHMLSDFASFLISLFAIWVATRKPSKSMSFGWHRAEVLGAVVSVLIIWVVTGVLVYKAIQRCIYQDFEIDSNAMLITAGAGVFVNVFMMVVLHQHGHGHGHGHGGERTGREREEGDHGQQNRERAGQQEGEERRERARTPRRGLQNKNINVHAAFIHVLGDLIQSIGIVIAGYIISFKPEWKLADPISTFLFSILVLVSTLNILKDTLRVLMEGAPKHINYEAVKADLVGIDGVKSAHSLQIWSITLNMTALAVHLALEPGANNQDVLERASSMLKDRYGIQQTTLQVEEFKAPMDDCQACQNITTPTRFSRFTHSFKFYRSSEEQTSTNTQCSNTQCA